MDLSASFDTVAELYNANRRGYPAPLYADLAAITGLGRQDAILEIGCGSGQATQGLVDLTDDVLALDPGAQLLNLARRRLSGQPGVEYANCSFEDWSLIEGRFRLVVSAQAWHWLDPRIAYEKAAAALVPDGWLAIFGHVPMPPTGQIGEDLRVAHARYAPPGYDGPSPESWYLPTGPVAGLITASALFGPVIHRG